MEVERETGTAFDVVVNIQGDEPFVSREQLELIQQCFEDSGTDIATLVKPFGPQEDVFNPNSPKVVVSAQGYALYFSRSVIPYRRGVEPQQWQEGFKYLKHIGMYAYRTGVLHRITDLPRGVWNSVNRLNNCVGSRTDSRLKWQRRFRKALRSIRRKTSKRRGRLWPGMAACNLFRARDLGNREKTVSLSSHIVLLRFVRIAPCDLLIL